jgi:SAM-dependent methyltransferase
MVINHGEYDTRGFVAELYDAVYLDRSARDVQFFVDYSRKATEGTLELGCGTGRVLIPAAISGAEITGLDISKQMLQKCRDKLSGLSMEVQQRVGLIHGNMADFETGKIYDLVTIPFRPFQHLISSHEQKTCLEHIHRHLATSGRLVLDVVNCYPPSMYDPKYRAEQESQQNLLLPGGRSLRCTTRISDFHRDQQYNDIELIYYVSNSDNTVERFVQSFPFRYFFRYELEHLLELCGFRVSDLFGDYDRSAYCNDSPEMIFVAEKK